MTQPSPPAWHAVATDEVVARLGSDARAGLSEEEVRRRRAVHGYNVLPIGESKPLAQVFFRQFKSPLIYLLLAASAVAFALGHLSDAMVIAVVVLINAGVGALQEGRAERSLVALRKLTQLSAHVIRGGSEQVIDARELVPGDLLVLGAGDAVAADGRLVDVATAQLSEAVLTGESAAVTKHVEALAEATLLADRRNMVFAGTHLASGRARAVVTATGQRTELGALAKLAQTAVEPKTPLEKRIGQFGHYVMVAAAVVFAAVVGIGLLRDVPFSDILMVAISQMVGMIPEGLPVAVTIGLAVGVQRMAKRRAVVRKLAAVETLGSTTLICSDKTGTLTRNEMTVSALWLPSGREVAVSGVGYGLQGALTEDGREVTRDADLVQLVEAALLCNDASVSGPHDEAPTYRPVGDPTEVALVVLGAKLGLNAATVRQLTPRLAELPFDPAQKMMATGHEDLAGRYVLIKGAPEAVLSLCAQARLAANDVPLDAPLRTRLHGAAEAMAQRALRVLAFAVVPGGTVEPARSFAAFEGEGIFLGFIGQLDPPRAEVADAVAQCLIAGVRPVVVTGDHKGTAVAIARALNIAGPSDRAVDGAELSAMSDEELMLRLDSIRVFARVHPAQKLRIVAAYQRAGHVVAMTGDGVNDAPALAKADVGVAMGVTGTEVAKEASRMVIADDNFATIVAAVEEGRVVHRNLKKAILYLSSTSMAEVAVLLLALVMGYPPPLAAVQILWINLVTEGAVTVNLVLDPPEGTEMRRGPIPPREPLINRLMLTRLLFLTPPITFSTLGWFIYRSSLGVPAAQVQTETFTVLAVCCWFNVLNCRSETKSAFDAGLLRNKWLIGGLFAANALQLAVVFLPSMNRIFHTVPFTIREFFYIGIVASLVLWVEEARKLFVRRMLERPSPPQLPALGKL